MLPASVKGVGASKMCSAGVERTGAPEASMVAVLVQVRCDGKLYFCVSHESEFWSSFLFGLQLHRLERGGWDYQAITLMLSVMNPGKSNRAAWSRRSYMQWRSNYMYTYVHAHRGKRTRNMARK